jgi:ABC-2 type transport system ATP-binding protein
MGDNMQKMIEVEGLVHRFGERTALEGVSFTVGRGEVFGLLGPNGAGKTTTVRLLNGLYSPAAGRIRVAGFDPRTQGREVRLRSGVLTETPALYERLSAFENLRFFAVLAGMPENSIAGRVMELLTFFGLQERARDRVGAFSKGMKQRLALARALLAHPEILFLDEPTSGLDPEAAQQVHALIAEVCRGEGRTVFLCTHNLFEAQRLCSRVAVMSRGRFKAVGSIDELRAQVAPGFQLELELLEEPARRLTQRLTALPGVLQINPDGVILRAVVEKREAAAGLVNELVRAGAGVLRVEPRDMSLEEIYFRLQNDGKDGQS